MKKATRAFRFPSGEEIFDANTIKQDDIIALSADKDFIGETRKLHQPSFEDYVVVGQINENQFKEEKPIIRVLAKHSWLEDEAVKQLEKCATTLPNIRLAVGMPDLHPGKGFPIGTAFASEGIIYPHLIGSDIGCGMSLYQTKLYSNKIKLDKWVNQLNIDDAWEGDVKKWLSGVNETNFDKDSLGTIGGGNHFAELQIIHKVQDEEEFKKLGLDSNKLFLLIHSGSRGYGASILRSHEDKYKTKGLIETSEEAKQYLLLHDNACKWAKRNRALIAHRFMDCIGGEVGDLIIDIWHNNVECKQFSSSFENRKFWIHRKGAAPSDKGPIVIPGSRGSFSYLVLPTNEKQEYSCYSVAHGAGRKWNRSKALAMGKQFKDSSSINITEIGSRVICEDSQLIYEEMPQAYKDIDQIVQDLSDYVKVIAILKPLISYKTRGSKYQK